MAFSMAFFAKRHTIGNNIPQAFICRKWYDMMRMKIYRRSLPFIVSISAILTCVFISLEYSLAPFCVFDFISCDPVFMGFVNVVFPFRLLGALALFSCIRIGDFSASMGAKLSDFPALCIFLHFVFANRTFYFYLYAGLAEFIKFINIVRPYSAHRAFFTNSALWSVVPCRAWGASRISPLFSHAGYLWGWFSAIRTWNTGKLLATSAYPETSAIAFTHYTQVFSHAPLYHNCPIGCEI